jgi:hypothetical protein
MVDVRDKRDVAERGSGHGKGDRLRLLGGQRPRDAVRGDSVLVGVGVVVFFVEGDSVLLRQRGVLVLFGTGFTIGTTEPEIEGPGTGLFQLSRFFEAAMTTLLHDRAPESEN